MILRSELDLELELCIEEYRKAVVLMSGSIVLACVVSAAVQHDTASTVDTSLAANTSSVGRLLVSDLAGKPQSSNRNAASRTEVQLRSQLHLHAEAISTAQVCNYRFPSNTRDSLSCLRSYSVMEFRDTEISDSMLYIAVRNHLSDQDLS